MKLCVSAPVQTKGGLVKEILWSSMLADPIAGLIHRGLDCHWKQRLASIVCFWKQGWLDQSHYLFTCTLIYFIFQWSKHTVTVRPHKELFQSVLTSFLCA